MPDHNHFKILADNPALVKSEGEFGQLMEHARHCAECSNTINQSMAFLDIVVEPLKKLGPHLSEAALVQLRSEGFQPLSDACIRVDQWHVTCCAVCRARYQTKASRRRLPSVLIWASAAVALLIATGLVMRYTMVRAARKAAAPDRGAVLPAQAAPPPEPRIGSPREGDTFLHVASRPPRATWLRPRRTGASAAVSKGYDPANAMPPAVKEKRLAAPAVEALDIAGGDTKEADNSVSLPTKKRVAVLDFDYGMVRSSVATIWGGDRNIGKGIADLLVQKLVVDGKVTVVERGALRAVLDEQHISANGSADATTLAKLGKLLNVDTIIVGSVTKLGHDDDRARSVGLISQDFGRKQNAKAVCDIAIQVVDVSSGEIVAAVTGNGRSARSAPSLIADGGNGSLDMSSAEFAHTMLGQAMAQSVISAGDKLEATAGTWHSHRPEVSGLVAEVSGNRLILNIGSHAGVRIGDRLEISRVVRSVKDPATGKAIRTVVAKIGDATVTDVDTESATAVFEGLEPAKVGDTARGPD